VFSATRSYSIGGTMVAVRNKTTGGPVSITALFGDRSGSITLGYTGPSAGGSQAEWYEPYGARRAGGIDATHRGWIGQTTDTTSGLNYLNHRYYDPTLGIFLSVDPLVDKTGQAYLYANGNPSTLSDPNGLDPCSHNGTCSGEYADQKDISNYNQSHGSPTVSKCNYQCALRNGTWGNGEGGFNRTAPSTMMYMKPASASQTVGLLLGVTLIAAAIAAAIALSPAEAIGASTPVVEELIDSGAGNQAQGAAQQVATNTADDLAIAESHLGSLPDGMTPPNRMMLDRIAAAQESGRALTVGEQNFLVHETTEAGLVSQGLSQDAAHAAALETHPLFMNYDPEVIKAYPEYFNSNWRKAWDLP